MMVVWLFLAVPWVCLRFVIVVFPDLPHFLFTGFGLSTIPSVCLSFHVSVIPLFIISFPLNTLRTNGYNFNQILYVHLC